MGEPVQQGCRAAPTGAAYPYCACKPINTLGPQRPLGTVAVWFALVRSIVSTPKTAFFHGAPTHLVSREVCNDWWLKHGPFLPAAFNLSNDLGSLKAAVEGAANRSDMNRPFAKNTYALVYAIIYRFVEATI